MMTATMSCAVLALHFAGMPQHVVAQSDFRVTLLGTGTPAPDPERFEAATLIEAGNTTLLVDAGRGASIRVSQMDISLGEIDGVFITHFHHDHISGLADLWLTGWLPPAFGSRAEPLEIWGPTGIEEVTDGLQAAYARDIDIRVADENLPRSAASFEVHEFSSGGIVYDQDDILVTAFPVSHGELIKPSYGYRIDYGQRSVLVSGDTTFDERIIEAGRGVDVLIHEVAIPHEELLERYPELQVINDHHTTPEEAGMIFHEVQPKLAVYTHLVIGSTPELPVTLDQLVQRTRATYNGPLVVGHDLMSIEIGDTVAVYHKD